jgi:hypothetical protein
MRLSGWVMSPRQSGRTPAVRPAGEAKQRATLDSAERRREITLPGASTFRESPLSAMRALRCYRCNGRPTARATSAAV